MTSMQRRRRDIHLQRDRSVRRGLVICASSSLLVAGTMAVPPGYWARRLRTRALRIRAPRPTPR